MDDIVVRAAIPADLEPLVVIWMEKMTIRSQVERHFMLAPDARQRWLAAAAAWLQERSTVFVTASSNTHPVGYLVGSVQAAPVGLVPERYGLISDLAVDGHAGRRHVGYRLVLEAADRFQAMGISQIAAAAARGLAVEQAFWQSQIKAHWMDMLWLT